MDNLHQTIKILTEKLSKKEMELRLEKSVRIDDPKETRKDTKKLSKRSIEQPKATEKLCESDTQSLEELNKKLEKLEKEKLDLQNELTKTVSEAPKRVSDVEKRKRLDSTDENKE